jgi:hypothetical protein
LPVRKPALVLIVVGAAGIAVAIFLWTAGDERPGNVLVSDARFPAALAPLDHGGLLYGERLSGRIREVDAAGNLRERPVAAVDVSTDGQRGLLGLAVDDNRRVFAAWTRPDLRLVVGRVAPGDHRLVWLGPETTDVANGGHIAFAPDGRLVIGIGDLRDPELVSDPAAPNGKLLTLDPDGTRNQRPEVLSSGWNNPFAFTFTPNGELWVADNAPGRGPERLARGDLPAPTITELDTKAAPSGLVAVDAARLLMCGFVSRSLQAYVIGSDGKVSADGEPLATDCALGVALLSDGRIVYASEDAIHVISR